MTLSKDRDLLLKKYQSSDSGLSTDQALKRKPLTKKKDSYFLSVLKLLFKNVYSPLTLLLVFAAAFSVYLKDELNALIIFVIVFISALISFLQEWRAYRASLQLIESMKMTHTLMRNGQEVHIKSEEIVEGDILCLDAGDLIPLDCILIESTDIFVSESSISGESLPKEKHVDIDPLLLTGSYIVSGMGKAVIITQNVESGFNELLSYLSKTQDVSSFSFHLLGFSKFLMKVTLIFTSLVFLILVINHKQALSSLIFALSIAVGLSPQLLPAILTTNLAIGARKMAKAGALTKKLESIENFGNMDLLCTDKTGTLTEGKIQMYAAVDKDGLKSDKVRLFGFINAALQTGFKNTLDQAIIDANHHLKITFQKLDEIPYDFHRKRLSIFAHIDSQNILISKGALENILSVCILTDDEKKILLERASRYAQEGLRVLGLASKTLSTPLISKTDESQMHFEGFLLFLDPIKQDAPATIQKLKDLGIRLVMITGDNQEIASYVAKHSGFERLKCVEGKDLKNLALPDLQKTLYDCDIFARVEPLDKAKLIEEFKKLDFTVGFLGDGINDSGAILAADVGISVETGSDMAKATADFILVKKHLRILTQAVKEGRKIFGNTLKYILMAVSANFGNMFSMALVALFIPFLPLLPTQILLINLLQDIPEMSISVDHVDHSVIKKPQKWDLNFIKKFMFIFGPISSLFDFATFFMLKYFSASSELFRSAWFTESVISATFIILFIRTRWKFYQSKPSFVLTSLIFSIIIFTLLIPYTPLGPLFDIIILPKPYYLAIAMIVGCYAVLVEIAKRIFDKWMHKKPMISS